LGQPLFKVELDPTSQKPKRNEVHPIYNLQFLLHRKITVKEPRVMVQYNAPTAKNMATPRYIVPYIPFTSPAGICTNLAFSRLINLIQIQKNLAIVVKTTQLITGDVLSTNILKVA